MPPLMPRFIPFKTLYLSIGGIIAVEACVTLHMRPVTGAYKAVLISRICQTTLMLILLRYTPNGFAAAGIDLKHAQKGMIHGSAWSVGFALIVLMVGGGLYVSGINVLDLISMPFPSHDRMVFLLTGMIFGPIAEELFFRGIVQGFFRRSGPATAIVLTTLLFAAMHMNGYGIPVIPAVGGFIFCLSFEKARHLLTPLIIHISGNMALYGLTAF
ncbi:CPBP family intramembrane glutamic endopeptidase [Desulfobacter latus]|uniref:CPBP family intramembrane metalloprotease n=1 Tax=Desulfobacter latus TaxID=2292 RepID=A0A850SWX7_9BACT|nr:type II CAAX endopeptidase family protein [Desulfobacter latus]NWH05649.1 CPBP family intramembrane metalloprotease [Desulfobacter latus]